MDNILKHVIAIKPNANRNFHLRFITSTMEINANGVQKVLYSKYRLQQEILQISAQRGEG